MKIVEKSKALSSTPFSPSGVAMGEVGMLESLLVTAG